MLATLIAEATATEITPLWAVTPDLIASIHAGTACDPFAARPLNEWQRTIDDSAYWDAQVAAYENMDVDGFDRYADSDRFMD